LTYRISDDVHTFNDIKIKHGQNYWSADNSTFEIINNSIDFKKIDIVQSLVDVIFCDSNQLRIKIK